MEPIVLRLGIDIDGVLADFASTYSYISNQFYNTPLVSHNDLRSWSLDEHLGLTRERGSAVWGAMSHEDWYSMECLISREEKRFLKVLTMNKYFEVWLVSKRPPRILDTTERWCQVNGIHYNQIRAHDERHKGLICVDEGIDIFLDDQIDNALDIYEAGKISYLRDWPYNRKAPPHIKRVNNLTEYLSECVLLRRSLTEQQ